MFHQEISTKITFFCSFSPNIITEKSGIAKLKLVRLIAIAKISIQMELKVIKEFDDIFPYIQQTIEKSGL